MSSRLSWILRPRVVLGLRVAWDFAFGDLLLFNAVLSLHLTGSLALGLLTAAVGTIAAGVWGAGSLLLDRRAVP